MTAIVWAHAWNRQMADLRAAVRAAGGRTGGSGMDAADAVCEALCKWLGAVGDATRAEERQALFAQVQERLRDWHAQRSAAPAAPAVPVGIQVLLDWDLVRGAAWPVGDN